MKILCLCSAGINRSVSVGAVLKSSDRIDLDVLCAGLDYNTEGTLKMLCDWADEILVVEDHMIGQLPDQESRDKAHLVNLGPDRWYKPNFELLALANEALPEHLRNEDF